MKTSPPTKRPPRRQRLLQRRAQLRRDERRHVGRDAPVVEGRFVRRVKPRSGEQILDMAGGTGDIAFRLAELGRQRDRRRHQPGDARSRDGARERTRHRRAGVDRGQNAEDAAFPRPLLRRLHDRVRHPQRDRHPKALREAHRVLRRGGRFFCLEFSTTLWPGFDDVYDAYSHRIVPKLGKLIARRRGQLSLSDRIDPPLPRHGRVRRR